METIITIHYMREVQLNNMLRGISLSKSIPDEVIVVNMGPTPKIDSAIDIPILIYQIEGTLNAKLPIGEARNLGASLAKYDILHFLDVDCIPSYNYFAKMATHLTKSSGLYMGSPKYLNYIPSSRFNIMELERQAINHPRRPQVENCIRTMDAGLFWSLCFSITKEDFYRLEEFDENFIGYGAEDTDLSFRCLDIDMPFYLCEAAVFHQQHNFHRPPLDKIEAIVDNCNYFFEKWHKWPMEKHLHAFAKAKYISWHPAQERAITIISLPSSYSIDKSLVQNEPYA